MNTQKPIDQTVVIRTAIETLNEDEMLKLSDFAWNLLRENVLFKKREQRLRDMELFILNPYESKKNALQLLLRERPESQKGSNVIPFPLKFG